MRRTKKLWNSKTLRTALAIVFVAFLIVGAMSGELTLIRIESATL